METAPSEQKGREQSNIVIKNRRPYTRVDGMEDVIEEFHQYYLQERRAGRTDYKGIFYEFRKNKDLDGVWFNPFKNQLESYYRNWEKELPMTMRTITIKKRDLPKKGVDDAPTVLREVAYHDLEENSKNLQSMLVEDATKMLQEADEQYEAIDENGGVWARGDYEKIRIAKKKYALAVAKEVLAGVHRHELIKIKRNQEGRETAGFLMDLVRRSTAGEIGDEEMSVLKTATM